MLTLGLFAALAFLPSSWAAYTLRVYRDNIFPALCLYFFAGMAGMALCAVLTPEKPLWPWLAALVLPLPLLHTHSALALVLLCLVGGVYTAGAGAPRRKTLLPWLGLAAVCGAAWLCQMLPTVLAQSLDGQHMLRLHFNWINGQDDGTLRDNYFWFYIKNIGLVYLLLIPAFLRAKPKQRWLYGGGLAILALAEFVVFQPNNYDNNKLLYVWHILGCILAAQLLVDIFAEVRALPWRALGLAACCFAGMFGSVLTVGREALSDYRQWSADDMALADAHLTKTPGATRCFDKRQPFNTGVALAGGGYSAGRAAMSTATAWTILPSTTPCGRCMRRRTRTRWPRGTSGTPCLTAVCTRNLRQMRAGMRQGMTYGMKMRRAACIR